jgi:hypothetical protein
MSQFRNGVARAVRAEEGEDLSPSHLEIDARDRLVAAVALNQAADADHRLGLGRHQLAPVRPMRVCSRRSGAGAYQAARPSIRWQADTSTARTSVASMTVICGLLADQPALHGLLTKVRDLGLCPISVRRLDTGQAETRHHDQT